ncbi:MAG: hypothetical protein K6C12_11400 [Oscillospiraceae bacterium]|nr:hypothetical protein [Oscillospiraceae bacterium]
MYLNAAGVDNLIETADIAHVEAGFALFGEYYRLRIAFPPNPRVAAMTVTSAILPGELKE